MNGLVAIPDHEIEISHCGKEVEVAVGFVASSRIVEGIERSIAVEELGGFIDDEGSEVFVDGTGIFLEKCLEGGVCKFGVTLEVESMAVDGDGLGKRGDFFLGVLNEIDVGSLMFQSFKLDSARVTNNEFFLIGY